MSSDVRILYDSDTWDAATITSSSEESDLVDGNVVDDFVGKVWRTTADSAEWIKFDLGAAAKLTCFSLFGFNLTAAATVTLEANATDSWATPSYSQALTIATDSDAVVLERVVLFLDQTYRWWRLTIADAANTDTYVQIGRIKAGEYYEPARTVTDGVGERISDPSQGDSPAGTHTHYRERKAYREIAIQFRFALRVQADKMYAIFRKVGIRTPIVFALDPTNKPSADSMYCHMTGPLPRVKSLVQYYQLGPLGLMEITE